MSASGPAQDNTRARLIAASAAEIRLIGPKRMTIIATARRLGMSHANVYRFFPNKAALLDAVLNDWLRTLEMRLTEIVDGPDPADDKLERFLTTLSRAYVDTLHQDLPVFRLLAMPEPEMIEAERHRRRIFDLVARIADEGMATRLFRGGDARRLVTLAMDLAWRFVDPASVMAADLGAPASDARRDRAIRWVVRAMTSQK